MYKRQNGSCAGGTGAFIDQMATLLKMSADEMDKAAQKSTRTYTIASRCGVFAKSDIQPLINQGAQAGDIAASIYQAVVNQTIAGLAQDVYKRQMLCCASAASAPLKPACATRWIFPLCPC